MKKSFIMNIKMDRSASSYNQAIKKALDQLTEEIYHTIKPSVPDAPDNILSINCTIEIETEHDNKTPIDCGYCKKERFC